MTRKRKPIGGLHPQPKPKRTMEDSDVSALRSPSKARTCLAEWPLIVDKPPDDQAAQVEMASKLGAARAPVEDGEPDPPRQRTPDNRDLKDAHVRDGELYGSPQLGGLHAKNAGHTAIKRRGPEDKVRPAARISQSPGRREGGQARDILDIDPVRPVEAAVVTLLAVPLTHSFPVVEGSAQLPLRGPPEELSKVVPPEPPALPDEAAAELNAVDILTNRSWSKAQDLGRFFDRQEPPRGLPVVHWSRGR